MAKRSAFATAKDSENSLEFNDCVKQTLMSPRRIAGRTVFLLQDELSLDLKAEVLLACNLRRAIGRIWR